MYIIKTTASGGGTAYLAKGGWDTTPDKREARRLPTRERAGAILSEFKSRFRRFRGDPTAAWIENLGGGGTRACECGRCADCLDAARKAADKRDATPDCPTCGGEGWFDGTGRAAGALVTCPCASDRRIRDAVARSRTETRNEE